MAETDVVIVGAGAGGLAAAWRLATRGARVTLLEAGRRYEPWRDYPQTSEDFALLGFPYDPVQDEAGRPRCTFGPAQAIGPEWEGYRSWSRVLGREAGERRRFGHYAHVQGVGGSTLHFQGEAHRFHPWSLQMRSRFGVAADWPVAWEELEHYYDVVEEQIGVAAPAENPWRPRRSVPAMPPHPWSFASARLAPAFEAAGAPLLPNALAILSRPHNGRPSCNYCNSCAQGCPLGDKGSADVVWLPAALATGRLALMTEARVTEVEVDRRGRASGVIWRDREGSERRVRARAVVLAAGAIETPRLLLLSTPRGFRQGLGNSAGQVGRNLAEHLMCALVALLPERVDAHRGVPIDATAWRFAVPEASPHGYVGGYRMSTAHGALDLRAPGAYAQRLIPGIGREHQRQMAERFGHAVGLVAMGDWLGNDGTRVDLDPWHRDATGRPVARIHSELGVNEFALLRRMIDHLRAVVAGVPGAEIVEETSALDVCNPAHVSGTCQMGTDPRASVADPDGVCHEVPNLAFADASLLPTGGSGDSPSLTIQALAVRTADRLLARLA